MIKINLVDVVPQGTKLIVKALFDEELLQDLPLVFQEMLEKKPHTIVYEVLFVENKAVKHEVLIKLGKKAASTKLLREEAGAELFKALQKRIDESLVLDIRTLGKEGLDIVSGLLLSKWRFNKYKSHLQKEEQIHLKELTIVTDRARDLEKEFDHLKACIAGVYYARELTSEPPNTMPPMAYANRLKELESIGVEVEILDQAKLEQAEMTALLAVSQGSVSPPAMAILKWKGSAKDSAPVLLVGKGVCFDSGGVCLKSTAHQQEMKWDKAGAGAVAGTIKALALAKAKVNVIGILGLVENMPDGGALKTGDVIKTQSNITVEVLNTDAEGRLVLADCLWYGQNRFNPSHVVDLGTLTMETFATLGFAYAGLYCKDQAFSKELVTVGDKAGEPLWPLPMGQFFARQIESSVADIKNTGIDFCGENGAAAEFLSRFVTCEKWAHLDISGVSWTKEDLPLAAKGVTGFGVRLLFEWLI